MKIQGWRNNNASLVQSWDCGEKEEINKKNHSGEWHDEMIFTSSDDDTEIKKWQYCIGIDQSMMEEMTCDEDDHPPNITQIKPWDPERSF